MNAIQEYYEDGLYEEIPPYIIVLIVDQVDRLKSVTSLIGY